MPPLPQPIGTIASTTASLPLVIFDARAATEWVATKAAATKAQFTGHPAEVMRGLSKGEDTAAIDVGASASFAFELEGKSGQIDAYRIGAVLALVAPPRAFWTDHAEEVDAMFAAILADPHDPHADDATEQGELELASGKLFAMNLWHHKVGAARDLAATVPPGGALAHGDGYHANAGLLVDLAPGTYTLARREVVAPWDDTRALVAMYLIPG
jgi:hypothetical protein